MKSVLTVFYSRSGQTGSVAQAICERLKGEREQLQERQGFSYMSAGLDALMGRAYELKETGTSPGDYDLVILGTPVWSMGLSCPVRQYIAAHKDEFHDVAFFCTEGGFGGQRAFRQMERLCGKEPLATLELRMAELGGKGSERKIAGFVDTLVKKLGT